MRFCPTCGSRFSNDVRFCPHDGQPAQELEEAPVDVDPWLGRVVDGRYRVERALGEGGMGIVYLVTHVALNKRMAMKVLREEMARDQDVVQRFIQEAQTSSAIGHANIIDISDFGRMPDGAVYFVMEFLEGESLTQRIARQGGPLALADAVEIVEQIASALGAAHAHGVIHRDLKPDNVFLVRRGDRDNFVKVLDFGIAKVGGAPSKLTRTGMVFGTPHYMSPEQAAGQVVDARADVYALGVIMYEMFTGVVPFDAETFMGILTKQMFEDPVPPLERGAPPEMGALEPIVLRALAKRPESRYQSMDAILRDIDTVRRGGTVPLTPSIAPPGRILAPPVGAARTSGRPAAATRRWPLLALALGVFLVAGGTAAGALYALVQRAEARLGASETNAVAPTPVAPPPVAEPALPRPSAGAAPAAAIAVAGSPATSASPGAPVAVAPAAPAPALPAVPGVRVTSEPSGAIVLVGETLIGQTPIELPASIASGSAVVLRLGGYADRTLAPAELAGGRAVHAVLEPRVRRRTAPRVATRPATAAPTMEPRPESPPPPRRQGFSEVVDPWGQ